ncbi:MAG: HpcH/HpaI aldolase family protein [Chloroflexota bacterium]
MEDTGRNDVKAALKAGRFAVGSFVTIGAPAVAEVMALAGFDFLVVDMQHGPLGIESVENLLRGIELAGAVPIVRVPDASPGAILQALNAGALGVQVPLVNTAEEARHVVAAAKYAPEGNRPVSMMRAARYTAGQPARYFARANAETLVIVHCETAQAVNNLPEILKVEGIDVVFVGPHDLSQSLGAAGQFNLPRVQETIGNALDTIVASGVTAGSHALSPAHARRLGERGVRYVTLAADYLFLLDRCRNDLVEARRPESE